MNVTCQNHISLVSSARLGLTLVQKVGNLSGIRIPDYVLLGRPARLQALYWFGTNLTFTWDFGDGTSATVSGVPHVQHVFNRTGEYWVKVVAHNAFSRAEHKTNVFVLEKPCKKPTVRICAVEEVSSHVPELSFNRLP